MHTCQPCKTATSSLSGPLLIFLCATWLHLTLAASNPGAFAGFLVLCLCSLCIRGETSFTWNGHRLCADIVHVPLNCCFSGFWSPAARHTKRVASPESETGETRTPRGVPAKGQTWPAAAVWAVGGQTPVPAPFPFPFPFPRYRPGAQPAGSALWSRAAAARGRQRRTAGRGPGPRPPPPPGPPPALPRELPAALEERFQPEAAQLRHHLSGEYMYVSISNTSTATAKLSFSKVF